ncbi:MAG: hypothetical protein M1817_003848 [Caeruleum heppii]|nr:MAG: hypothetical protein M1817_003848 [Caeruleum heppii]
MSDVKDLHDLPLDQLLEQYLLVLDQYTSRRELLNRTLSSGHINLALANITSARHLRYGPADYDERMKADRNLDIVSDGSSTVSFRLIYPSTSQATGTLEAQNVNGPTKPNPIPPRWVGILVEPPMKRAHASFVQGVDQAVSLAEVQLRLSDLEGNIDRSRRQQSRGTE